MKKLRGIVATIIVMVFCLNNYKISYANTVEEISDEDFNMIMQVLCNSVLEDGDVIKVGDSYTIEVSENVDQNIIPYSPVYNLTKSSTVSIKSNNVKVFDVTQTVTANFNTITEKVAVTSHSVTVTPYSSSISYVSQTQISTLNSPNSTFIASNKIVRILKSSVYYDFTAGVTVWYSGESFDFRIDGPW